MCQTSFAPSLLSPTNIYRREIRFIDEIKMFLLKLFQVGELSTTYCDILGQGSQKQMDGIAMKC
jgi:hypothetical protein